MQVQAILDCFHPQYKFLPYDGPPFLKAGNFPSVMEKGQGWECPEEALVCSPSLPWIKQWQNTWKRHSGRADPCVRLPLFSLWRASASCVDAAGTSSMQLHSPTLEDVREEEGLIWPGGEGGGMGHLGIFVRDMKEHLCWGARSPLRIVCAGPVFKGNVWIFD